MLAAAGSSGIGPMSSTDTSLAFRRLEGAISCVSTAARSFAHPVSSSRETTIALPRNHATAKAFTASLPATTSIGAGRPARSLNVSSSATARDPCGSSGQATRRLRRTRRAMRTSTLGVSDARTPSAAAAASHPPAPLVSRNPARVPTVADPYSSYRTPPGTS